MGRIKKAVFKFRPFSKKQKKILTWWLPNSPVHDQDESEYHSSEMREVRHVVARIIGKTCIQFYQGISDNEEFCLDRERQREDKQLVVGIQHSECQQNGVNGS